MRSRSVRMIFALTLAATFAGVDASMADSVPKGFTPIFNGKDLTGWHGMPHFDPHTLAKMTAEEKAKKIEEWTADAKKHWSVEDGELVNDGYGAYLTTDKDYGDIELLIDYKTVPKADSGIYLRATPQVQIWDYTTEGGKQNIGADKGRAASGTTAPAHPAKTRWFWPTSRSANGTSCGSFRSVPRQPFTSTASWWSTSPRWRISGTAKPPLFAKGPIQLQTHGGEIRWKNIVVREIPADEANKMLSEHGAEGFKPIFDGKTLTGWAGADENYEVVDGAIRLQAGNGRRRLFRQGICRLLRTRRVQASSQAATTAWRSATRARAIPPTLACASSRSSTTAIPSTAILTPARPMARPTGWPPPFADSSVPPASGTLKR